MVADLLGRLAHDFNNILGIIIGNLDVLGDLKCGNPAVNDLAKEALDAATGGSALTKRLLAIAGRQTLRPASVDLGALLPDLAAAWRRSLGPSLRIDCALAPEPWPVFADRSELRAALVALAENAATAMPGGGILTIGAENRSVAAAQGAPLGLAAGDYGMIELRDTGVGIPPASLPRIFEPFFTTKQGVRGSGLGLSVVAGFARQSCGCIDVESEAGRGTIARLFLPRA
jgi:signal transduction histidine kinase